ncbi:NAD(P)H-hydrate epimerase [Oscillatoria amoena NRMC-F 0135]|nr:NAD(P)H-hydrate epimerase [Oscillatoria amoena NRMC-F 0135]
MIKFLSSNQIRELDAYTIQHELIASIDLMERACRAFCDWYAQHFDESNKIGIVCGTGNNGGDGLGIARLLHDWGYPVKVWIIQGTVAESDDFKFNRDRLQDKIEVVQIHSQASSDLFIGCDVLIDAIFGSGLSRPFKEFMPTLLNRSTKPMPSGLLLIFHQACLLIAHLPEQSSGHTTPFHFSCQSWRL